MIRMESYADTMREAGNLFLVSDVEEELHQIMEKADLV